MPPENLKIPRFQRPGILFNLPEIRVDFILADFVRNYRLCGDQAAGRFADLNLFHTGSILNLNFLCGLSVCIFLLLRKNNGIILMHGRGTVGLHMSQRGIAHAVGAANQPLFAETHADKIVILRQYQGKMLKVIAALRINRRLSRAL